jgi:hypothetical protein
VSIGLSVFCNLQPAAPILLNPYFVLEGVPDGLTIEVDSD